MSTVQKALPKRLSSIRDSNGASHRQMKPGVKLGNTFIRRQISVCQPAAAKIAIKSLLRKLSSPAAR